MTVHKDLYSIPATGDVCVGDEILFSEAVFGGSFRKPKFLGEREIAARVVKDSYGAAKQQHTFTLEILASDGYQPLTAGSMTTRKGRNVYRNGTSRKPWADEAARRTALDKKHGRGDAARAARQARKDEAWL
ncbi:hypothetical protein [Parvibaculum sp.]|uniref:hypothetical protein n=1 Tax=Parvibaculum sp. TaxID=2024848 RepID=UPI00273228A6|nr:hypothetical protein [Parvibaculum sp.]MDP1628879.1 hypothetical protein [Parvibaculum sp.]MDP2148274.1 hypothetical protein [Parvibaculum sp.]MDP3327729.1 hypothetical protein [Parvibaculum sp.]